VLQTAFRVQTRKLCYKSVMAEQCYLKHGYTSFTKLSKMAEKVYRKPRLGRPSASSTENNINQVKEIILHNRLSSLRDIAREVHIFNESIRSILVDILGMRRVNACIVPKELNFLQKQYRQQISLDMLDHANSNATFMERIITGDETWVYEFDMQTSQQSSEWRTKAEPKPKQSRQSLLKVKVVLIVFFDIRVWRIMNSFLKDKHSTRNTIYNKKSVKKGQKCGRTIPGSCMMIMHHRIEQNGD